MAGNAKNGRARHEQLAGAGRTGEDKERSRQQSRPVSAREAARSAGAGRRPAKPGAAGRPANETVETSARGGGRGGAASKGSAAKVKPRPLGARSRPGRATTGRRTHPGAAHRSPATLLTWGTVALVLLIVVVLVIVKVSQGSSSSTASSAPLPAQVARDVTSIPASVYNTVGVSSPTVAVTKPSVAQGQPPFALAANGKTLPGVFYFGAEYCPFCAAERWALVTALSRFGKFSGLRGTSSSSQDVYPNTQTLSFYKSTFSSPYVAFDPVEAYSNQPASGGVGYQTLQTPSAAQVALVRKYDTTKYVTSLSSSSQNGSIPFIDFGNKVLMAGANYSPAVLSGLSRAQIAGDLHDPKNPVTQAVIATANYLTAAVCAIDGGRPGAVCTSKGVTAASKALSLSS